MGELIVGAVQMACGDDAERNLCRAEALVREAAEKGARIILLQELFETRYFCQVKDPAFFDLARPLEKNPAVARMTEVARQLEVVLPVSFFESANQACYNTVAVIDADGSIMGTYRKTHIPDGPGYEEKYYFNPGDTGFRVWPTRYAPIGVGICWDQWFPEAARSMVLMGAEILFYPTAIGSEPANPALDSKPHWQVCMRGHAAANMVPVVAANRVGRETFGSTEIRFYGSSFVADPTGGIVVEADRSTETVIVATLDLDRMREDRRNWGLFRDRRPDHYGALVTSDGSTQKSLK
jgi:N-carbamoylputrescine amidase